MNGLGILADDAMREAFIEECKRQLEWKKTVDEAMNSSESSLKNEARVPRKTS